MAVVIFKFLAGANAVIGKNIQFFTFKVMTGSKLVFWIDRLGVISVYIPLISRGKICAGYYIEDRTPFSFVPRRRICNYLNGFNIGCGLTLEQRLQF